MTLELALILALATAAGGIPKTWTPEERGLLPTITGRNPTSCDLLRMGLSQDAVDFGLEWPSPQGLDHIVFEFRALGGRAYEPSVLASHLEVRVAGRWRPQIADLAIDYTYLKHFAPIQGYGLSQWMFSFEKVDADAIRLRADAPAHIDPGYQCIALQYVSAGSGAPSFPELTGPAPSGRVTFKGRAPADPEWLEPGADLASAGKVTRGECTVVRWAKPMMVDSVRIDDLIYHTEIEFEASPGKWRPVGALHRVRDGLFRFTPVATTGLRIHAKAKCQVLFDQEGREYFTQVQASRSDLLGERFRHSQTRDLAEMSSYLLPIDFAKAAIGRPGDLHETIVTWTGTFLMTEPAEAMDRQTDKKLPAETVDRWFAPVTANGAFGENWMDVHSRYLNGWMPAVVTDYMEGGLTYTQTVFVTSPDRKLYGNVAIVEVENDTDKLRNGQFAYAMGRRPKFGEPWTPFSQSPLVPGYTLDRHSGTVRDEHGLVVFQASGPVRLSGSAYEMHLVSSFKLAPGQKKTLTFFVPNVDAPIRDVPSLNPAEELASFRAWWTKLMDAGAQMDVPETPLNELYKNLLAQALIITLDGDQVRYGAYAYECYFGVEEGWPAVALAQYGFGETARRIAELMLAPDLMDKANYHHQYRNGLDPWYAITIGRLTQDWDWLKKQMPMIRSCADWTIKATGDNKDARYGGLLPKHVYGGDVGMPAYSFYSNATCYRGLHDTAVAMDLFGDAEDAHRYGAAAEAYRKRILTLADNLVDRSSGLPFLPMSFDLDAPSGRLDREPSYPFLASHTTSGDTWGYVGNYWNLFAPLLHEVRLFDQSDPRSRWIPGYVERRGGLLAGLARFDLGLDHIYGKGYIESLLEAGRREEFLTSLYGVLAHGMSRNLYSSPEVSGVFPLRTDNLAQAREHDRERWNWLFRPIGGWMGGWQNQEGEPLSAGAGMALQLLRMALVREDFSADPPVGLRLLDGAPAHWFEKGKHVALRNMRTFFGPVSFRVDAGVNLFRAKLVLPNADCVLRLPHPGGRKLSAVTVNGVPWLRFSGNQVSGLRGSVRLEAQFGR